MRYKSEKIFRIFEDISNKSVLKIIKALIRAEKGDKITILIRSEGGYSDSALWLCKHIMTSEAFVETIGVSFVHSCAVDVLLAGDKITLDRYANILIHNIDAEDSGDRSSKESQKRTARYYYRLGTLDLFFKSIVAKGDIELSGGALAKLAKKYKKIESI